MSGITDLLGNQDSRVEKFASLAEGKSASEKRALEEHLLRPEKLKPYTGNEPPLSAKNGLLSRTVKFIFSEDELEVVKKWFPVSNHIEMSVSNHTLLKLFLQALENGTIEYNKKERALYVDGKKEDGKEVQSNGSGSKRTLLDWKMYKQLPLLRQWIMSKYPD